MDRLISADALLKYIEENNTEREWCVNNYNADWIWSFIDNAPTIDAEPVVRCGECKHFNGEIPYHYCRKAGGNFKIDSFCSYGERRAE